jgi:hypothetical protein
MSLWRWITGAFRRQAVPEPPPSPLTPPAEHAEATRRVKRLQGDADRLERLARDYRRMDSGLQ